MSFSSSRFSSYLPGDIARPDLFGFAGLDAFDLAKNLPKKALGGSTALAPSRRIRGRERVKPIPPGRIRLGLGFFAKDVTSEFAAFIILHELAHLVAAAERDGIEIIDSGRGWFDDIFIKPLTAKKRLANADSSPPSPKNVGRGASPSQFL